MVKRRFPATTICFLISIISFSQADSAYKKLNEQINNQRRQEKNWSQRVQQGIYVKQGFERYNGKIEVLGDTAIKYDEVVLQLHTERPEYRIIFEKGIFYPSVLNGNYSGGSWEKTKNGLSDSTNIFNSPSSSIGVGVYEEIKTKENTYKTKRFRFWVWRRGLMNPKEYIMDLENDSATETTDLKTFIINSKLTYIKFITIII
jgi:hypothetical protein